MKTLIRMGMCVFLFSIAFASSLCAEEKESNNEQRKVDLRATHNIELPNGIQKYLREKLPDYKPVKKKDYEQVWFEKGGDDIPHWSAAGDYDGNGKDDYAVLVKHKDSVALVVVRSLEKTYTHDILRVEESGSPVTMVVRNVEPGWTNISSIDDPTPEKKYLRNPSLRTGILETCSAYRYYWEDGEWHEVYIGV